MFWHLRSVLRPLPKCRVPYRQFTFTRPGRLPAAEPNAQQAPWNISIPSFRQQLGRLRDVPSFGDKVKRPAIGGQIIFFVAGSVLTFAVAANVTNIETYMWSIRLIESAPAWKDRPPTNDEMRRARYYALGKQLQQRLALMKDAVEEWPQAFKAMLIWTYIQFAQPVLDTSEVRRWCWGIGVVNGIIYLAWQFPRLQPLMQRRFIHNPLSGLSGTMFTSLLSHRSILHLAVDSMALAAFGSAASQYFFEQQGRDPDNLREATPRWHFLAFCTSAGLFSILVSHIAYARLTYPRLVSRLKSTAGSSTASASSSFTPPRGRIASFFSKHTKEVPIALGASGVVYAAFTVVTLAYPDTDLAFKIPPTFPIPISFALCALLAFDFAGVIYGWRVFNHWAHLGGAAFGALYYEYGPEIWELFRELMLDDLPPSLCNLDEDEGDEDLFQ
ncbi:uncharacterized protein LAESUDRAFT_651213 [Laetiporus sulphureus 93-53]|uniref:Peptidase S54 rhomboid domain-containing protein n=1 Tax=Laetiporus sulphureus 93-53 TaxID=1314785 RepID=A0A165EN29_9APHY|nr:uncharacterized protein LAESUDRAFT_651213 [Laetiporus sulphureus 93-53]KZT07405.1 hypothetical protein LAESUDRAFT_651213 [Laetiporus sulphureus 93-53]